MANDLTGLTGTDAKRTFQAAHIVEANREGANRIICRVEGSAVVSVLDQSGCLSAVSTVQADPKGWSGAQTWKEALTRITQGWPEGTAQTARLAAKLTPRMPRSVRHKIERRPSMVPRGPVVISYPAIVTDLPCPFVGHFRTRELQQHGKIVRIGVNVGASCGVKAEILAARGAAVFVLMQTLQKFGKSVELHALMPIDGRANHGQRKVLIDWTLQSAGAHVNPDILAAVLCSAAGLRRYGFAIMDMLPQDYQFDSRGWPMPLTHEWPDVTRQYDVLIDSDSIDGAAGMKPWTDDDVAVEWVKAQLRAQGIDAE